VNVAVLERGTEDLNSAGRLVSSPQALKMLLGLQQSLEDTVVRNHARKWQVILLAVTTVFGGAAIVLLLLTAYSAPLDSYKRGVDEQHFIVYARLGIGDSVLWSDTRESDNDVTVSVWVRREPGPKPLLALREAVTIELKRPLGNRKLLDRDGRPVSEQR
jgi:hypothetical protein